MALNQYSCVNTFGNTGLSRCALIPASIVGMFLVPANFVITDANAAALQEFMVDKAKESSRADRIFPIHNFVDMVDNSEELVSETTGYGVTIPLRDGNYSWTFRFFQGGLCLLKALQNFNNQNISALFYDANGVVYGRNITAGLAGIPLASFYAGKWVPATGTTAANFPITVTFDPKYLNKDLGFVSDDEFTASEIVGLQDVTIKAVGAQADTVLTVQVLESCGGDNLFELYSTELASGPLWSVVNQTTGAVETITTVAANAGNSSFTITLDAARTASSIVSLQDVDTLEAADIFGIESGTTVIPLA